jgi:hypothetical protein
MVTGKAVALFEEIRRRGGSRQLEAFLYLGPRWSSIMISPFASATLK